MCAAILNACELLNDIRVWFVSSAAAVCGYKCYSCVGRDVLPPVLLFHVIGRRLEALEEFMQASEHKVSATAQAIEWGKTGIVQKEQQAKARLELEQAQAKGIAR